MKRASEVITLPIGTRRDIGYAQDHKGAVGEWGSDSGPGYGDGYSGWATARDGADIIEWSTTSSVAAEARLILLQDVGPSVAHLFKSASSRASTAPCEELIRPQPLNDGTRKVNVNHPTSTRPSKVSARHGSHEKVDYGC